MRCKRDTLNIVETRLSFLRTRDFFVVVDLLVDLVKALAPCRSCYVTCVDLLAAIEQYVLLRARPVDGLKSTGL